MSPMTTDVWLGEHQSRSLSHWLSPLMIGLVAPIVACLTLFPDTLRDATGILVPLLLAIMLIAIGAYVAGVMLPSTPVALVVRPDQKVVSIVLRSPVSQREETIPFKEVSRLSAGRGSDRDGYERAHVELKTKAGDAWVVPCDLDDSELARARGLIGLDKRAR